MTYKFNDKAGYIALAILFILFILLRAQKEPDFVIKYIEGHKYIITNQGGICHDEDCDNPTHWAAEPTN